MEGPCEKCIASKDNLDSFDSDGFAVVCVTSSELSFAAEKGHDKCLEHFIQAGADVNKIDNTTTEGTPLIRAAQGGHWKCVELLLKAGADVNARNKNSKGQKNRTAVTEASAKGYAKCVELLIEAGADVNVTNPSGLTPLVFATTKLGQDRLKCVDLLLKAGADVNHRCGNENSALICATIGANNEQCIKLLLEGGADVNQTGKDGKTALMTAIQWDHPSYVEILLKAGADVNLMDKSKENVLMKFLKRNLKASLNFELRPRIFSLLLEAGADVNQHFEGDHGNTPLILAIDVNDDRLVKLILEAGADVNAVNNYWCTALMTAVIRGSPHLKRLLEEGADVNMKDIWGRTALSLAVDNCFTYTSRHPRRRHLRIEKDPKLELLIEAGADTELGRAAVLDMNSDCNTVEIKVVTSHLREETKLYHKNHGKSGIRND